MLHFTSGITEFIDHTKDVLTYFFFFQHASVSGHELMLFYNLFHGGPSVNTVHPILSKGKPWAEKKIRMHILSKGPAALH